MIIFILEMMIKFFYQDKVLFKLETWWQFLKFGLLVLGFITISASGYAQRDKVKGEKDRHEIPRKHRQRMQVDDIGGLMRHQMRKPV